MTSLVSPEMRVHYSSKKDEWLTPFEILARVTRCLGGIDLDPCSNVGDPRVPARHHYAPPADGLAEEWRGRVFMNPPYGRAIGKWVGKLAREYAAGRVTSAIALVPARTDTRWFRHLYGFPWCFVRGRLRFSESEGVAPFPSVLAYMGADLWSFVDAFDDVGIVVHSVLKEEFGG